VTPPGDDAGQFRIVHALPDRLNRVTMLDQVAAGSRSTL